MLQYDLDNENETIRNYRDRIRQCEALGEYAMAEQIRQILMQEQDHQVRESVAQPLKTMKTRACDRFPIVYLLYWNFLPRLGKPLNTRWNFELGDGSLPKAPVQ